MKNVKVDVVVSEFVIGGRFGENCKTSNNSLLHDSGCLVNYNTIIGLKLGGTVIINKRKYSTTTSKNQNKIRRMCQDMNIPMIEVDEKVINCLSSDFHGGKCPYTLLQDLQDDMERQETLDILLAEA